MFPVLQTRHVGRDRTDGFRNGGPPQVRGELKESGGCRIEIVFRTRAFGRPVRERFHVRLFQERTALAYDLIPFRKANIDHEVYGIRIDSGCSVQYVIVMDDPASVGCGDLHWGSFRKQIAVLSLRLVYHTAEKTKVPPYSRLKSRVCGGIFVNYAELFGVMCGKVR